VARFRFDGRGEQVAVTMNGCVSEGVVQDVYRRWALPLILQALDLEVLHASAVRGPTGVVGFCGDSEAGKSTLAYGLSRRGYPAWADDALALWVFEGSARAVPLPFALRLRHASAAFFGCDARGPLGSPPSPAITEQGSRLVTLCVLERRDISDVAVEVEVSRVSGVAAFAAIAAHAYCFSLKDEARRHRMVERYLALAARVPVLRVRYGSDLMRLSELIDAVEVVVRDGAESAC
jgi:hypothetical protein